MRRAIKLNGLEKELEIGKVNMVRKKHSQKEFIYFEKMEIGD